MEIHATCPIVTVNDRMRRKNFLLVKKAIFYLLQGSKVKSKSMNTLFCHLSLLTPCLHDCSLQGRYEVLGICMTQRRYGSRVRVVNKFWSTLEIKSTYSYSTNKMFELLNRSYLSSCFMNDNLRVEQGI